MKLEEPVASGEVDNMELSWGAAFAGTIVFAAGLCLEELGRLLARRTRSRMSRMLLVWPCTALGYGLIAVAAVLILWNLIAPIVEGVIRVMR